jgi:mono/diheme cytochrome c family protein
MGGRFGWAARFAALTLAMVAPLPAQCATAPRYSEAAQATVDEGKAIYAERCSHCHGPNMVNAGTITPDLRRFADDRQRFVNTVKQGKNNRMPPWGDILSDDDIAALWAYVSSRRSQ